MTAERAERPGAGTLTPLASHRRWLEVGRIALVGAIAIAYWRGWVALPLLLVAVAVGLFPLASKGLLGLLRERKVGTEVFITLATVIALWGGEYVAGSILLTIILVAELIADFNTERARASIRALVGSVPRTALMRRDDREVEVPIEELRAGDVVVVRAGERIPVDGTVSGGDGAVDEATITGENLPRDKDPGADVYAGTVVASGAIDVTARKLGADTLFSRIVALVETAEEQRAPVQRLADRVAAWLIPVVFAFLALAFLLTRDVRLIVTLLIFTSPAELGLATPLVMIAAVARAARAGILVKGGAHLEVLAKADTLVFDKTGTLTTGALEVTSIEAYGEIDEREILRLASAAERRSGHPLAKAVVSRARREGLEPPDVERFKDVRGRGVEVVLEGERLLVGNASFLDESGVPAPPGDRLGETVMFVARPDRALGAIHLADRVRPGAREAIAALRGSGIESVVMLTGDNAEAAARVAREVGIDDVRSGLLPEQKVEAIRTLHAAGRRVAMVGDGVNDAPALAAADVGIAMGVAGTAAALEAADVALMTDDLGKIVQARAIAARAYRTIIENLVVGVGLVHVAGIAAALLRLIGPIQAALLHLGPDILVFLNSIKLLRVKLS